MEATNTRLPIIGTVLSGPLLADYFFGITLDASLPRYAVVTLSILSLAVGLLAIVRLRESDSWRLSSFVLVVIPFAVALISIAAWNVRPLIPLVE